VALFPRQNEPGGTRIPIFYAETPSPVTVKGMAASMLAHLGDPAACHGALWAMNYRLIRLMLDCQVELVILDDFHHLIDKETNRVLEQVSDWLKVLIKETGIPFLVVGIEGKVERILEANAQLSRLFAVRQTLAPFRCDPTDAASIQEFARFVQYAEQAVAMTLPTTLPRLELVQRLHEATQGVVGNLMNLLRYAAWLTQQQAPVAQPALAPPTMALATLAAAYDKRLAKHLKRPANPFLVPLATTLPDVPARSTAAPPVAQRRARRSASQSQPTPAVQSETTHAD